MNPNPQRPTLNLDVLQFCADESIPPTTVMKIAQTVLASINAKQLTRAERDQLIRTEWNGRNTRELMRRFGISRSTLYRIINR